MNAASPLFFLMVSAVFLLAGLVKGVVGLGLPTVAVGLLGLIMSPMEAAGLLVVPSLVTNVWQLAAGPGLIPLLRRLWPLLAATAIGTLSGPFLMPHGFASHATPALGLALILYALTGLAAVHLNVPRRLEAWLSPVAGAMTGWVTSATGVFMIPAVPYLQGLGLGRNDLVQALGLAFTVSTCALAASLALDGAFRPAVATTSLYALAPALAGMFAGQWIRNRIRPEVFRRVFFIGLLLLGAHLGWAGLR